MGAFVPGTLILANSPEGQALLAQGTTASALPTLYTPEILPVTTKAISAGGGGDGAGIPVDGGFLSGIGGGDAQGAVTAFQNKLKQTFPDPNDKICGVNLDVSDWNGGQPATLNIPCDSGSPGPADMTAGQLETVLIFQGAASMLTLLSKFIKVQPSLSSTGSGGTYQGTTNVTINVQTDYANNVLRAVTNGISAGIDNSAATAAKIAEDTTSQITSSLSNFTDQLGTSVGNIGGFLGGVLDNTLNNLFNPTSLFENSINGSLGAVASLINSIEGEIVGPLEQQVSAINAAFGGLPASIESIFSGLIKDLPNLLGPIIIALGPLGDQLKNIAEVIISHLPGAKGKVLWEDYGDLLGEIARAGAAIAGAAQTPDTVVYRPMDPLGISCGSVEETQKKIDDWVGSNIKLPCWAQDGLKIVRLAFVELLRLIPFIEQFYQQSEELQNKSCPLNKLDPATMVHAWQRGITSEDNLLDETAAQGYNKARVQILKDLAGYYYRVQEAIDLFYRQVITPDQLNTLLAENGMNAQQIQAAKDGSFRITPIEEAITAWNRKILNDDDLSKILGTNRLNTVQQDILKAISRRPPTVQEALQGQLTRNALQGLQLGSFTDYDTIPSWLDQFGTANGLDESAIQSVWWSHFNTGGIRDWITAYYRGLRFYSDLVNISKGLGIPETILEDLINIGRPLIPYRSIPGFVKAGVMSRDQGSDELKHHGFDQQHVDWILAYAGRTSTAATATAVSGIGALSIGTARTLFDDGAITEDQYVSILEAHKFPPDVARAQAEAERLASITKQRKSAISALEAEVEAGLLTIDAAISQLQTQGYTQVEIARFEVTVRRATAKNAKHPSIAELDKFVKAQLITPDQYKTELEAQGWADPWLSAFIGLLVAPTPQPLAPGAPAV